jgi:hypothetical protein
MEKFVTTLIVTCTSIAHTKLEAEAEEAASKFVLPPSYRHSGSISEKHACIATPGWHTGGTFQRGLTVAGGGCTQAFGVS